MAIDNRLRVYDEQGNPVDYDILANDVKFLPDGKDLPTKLAELEDEIDDAAQTAGEGTVKGVKMNNGSPIEPDGDGVVDLGTVITAHQDISGKANASDVYTKTQADTLLAGKLSKSDVSVETQGDGTVDINVKDDTYTINLNHTHENMAKLVVDTAANLPDASEMESGTIYGELDDGEIATIYLGGYPFYGGGGGASSGPVLRRPADGATIDMGQTTSGTVSKAINVKGKSLTQALTIELDGIGYSFGSTQQSGVTRDSSTQLTVTAAAANTLNGVDIVVVYTGSDTDENASGTLGITSASPDSISTEVTLVANKVTYEDLAGVKLTGTQWLQTNYYPNAKTEFTMKVKFTSKGNNFDSNHAYFLTCATNTSADGEKFQLYHTGFNNIVICNKTTAYYNGSSSDAQQVLASAADFVLDNSIISYTKGTTQGTIAFIPGGDNSKKLTHATSLKEHDMQNPVRIGRGNTYIYEQYELTIKELTFTEDGVTVQHWVPRSLNGVAGLLDTENGTFITSEVEGQPLVAVPLSNN